MDKEQLLWNQYEQLSEEIKSADSLNYQVLGVVIAAAVALINAAFTRQSPDERSLILLTVFAVTIPGRFLLEAARRRIWRVAAYLEVFIEPALAPIQWQSRLNAKFSATETPVRTHIISTEFWLVSGLDLVAGILVIATAGFIEDASRRNLDMTLAFVLMLHSCYRALLARARFDRMGKVHEEHLRSWEAVRAQEPQEYCFLDMQPTAPAPPGRTTPNQPEDFPVLRPVRQILLSVLGTLYSYRAPLLVGLSLIGLAFSWQSPMVSGLFALNSWDQYWVSFLVTLLGGQIFVIVRIFQLHGPERLNFTVASVVPDFLHRQRRWFRWVWAFLIAVVPVIVLIHRLAMLPDHHLLFILGGLLSGTAVFAVCLILENLAAPAEDEQIFPIPQLQRRTLGPLQWIADIVADWFCWTIRLIDDSTAGFMRRGRALAGHLLALACTTALMLLYFGSFALGTYWPGLNMGPGHVKAIFYLLLVISLGGSVVSFLCFLLDRHRLPVITLVLIAGFLISLRPKNAHYYQIMRAKESAPANATDLWKGTTDRVIIVSAQGGGIQAAAWTTRVLTGIVRQLPEELQRRFLESTRLLSGVSGGSTGLMFYQTAYEGGKLPDKAAMERISAAGTDGTALSWIGFGLAHYDLTRPFDLSFQYSLKDRGSASEQAWSEILRHQLSVSPDRMMNELREGVSEGRRPLIVFSATNADRGTPLLISNFDLKEHRDFRSFHDLYPGKDLKLTTAVRLSASFPWVSPSPRPFLEQEPFAHREGKDYAIIDGGLYDNFGVAGAYFTLQQATAGFTQELSRRVLWLQIRLPEGTNDKTNPLAYSAIGPLLTLDGTRASGQRSRADQLSRLAALEARGEHRLEIDYFDYPLENAPLSWALTDSQTRDIERGWTTLKNGYRSMKQVCQFLATPEEIGSGTCEAVAQPWAKN